MIWQVLNYVKNYVKNLTMLKIKKAIKKIQIFYYLNVLFQTETKATQ